MALWDAGSSETVPEADFTDMYHDPAALRHWLARVTRCGFGKVTNGPIESGALFTIVGLFGFVRETNYGRHFDLRTQLSSTNLTYNGLGLLAHTDTCTAIPSPPCRCFIAS